MRDNAARTIMLSLSRMPCSVKAYPLSEGDVNFIFEQIYHGIELNEEFAHASD